MSVRGFVSEFFKTFPPEDDIPDGQDFVHDQDLAVQMDGNRKSQFHIHTAGVAFYRSINEGTDLGKFDDGVHLGIDLFSGHTQYGAVEVDVFPPGHFAVKSGSDLQQGGHPAVQIDVAARGGCDPGQELEQSAFSCSVAADHTKAFPFLDVKADMVQSKETAVPLLPAQGSVGVFAPGPGSPPALKFVLQGSAADLPEPVFFTNIHNVDDRIAHGYLF